MGLGDCNQFTTINNHRAYNGLLCRILSEPGTIQRAMEKLKGIPVHCSEDSWHSCYRQSTRESISVGLHAKQES